MKLLKQMLLLAFFSLLYGNVKAQISDTLRLYPNPFVNQTNIQFTLIETDTISVSIFSMLGQIVLQPITGQIIPGGLQTLNVNTSSLSPGVYFIKIDFGSGLVKNIRGIKAGDVTPTHDNLTSNQAQILYPNPSSGLVSFPGEGIKNIQISNLKGQFVKEFKTTENQISISDLKNGVYFIEIQNKEKDLILRERLIKTD